MRLSNNIHCHFKSNVSLFKPMTLYDATKSMIAEEVAACAANGLGNLTRHDISAEHLVQPLPVYGPSLNEHNDLVLSEILELPDDLISCDESSCKRSKTDFDDADDDDDDDVDTFLRIHAFPDPPSLIQVPFMPAKLALSGTVTSAEADKRSIPSPIMLPDARPDLEATLSIKNDTLVDDGTQESAAGKTDERCTGKGEKNTRFLGFQASDWTARFLQLCDFRKRFGHCIVHHNFNENLPLARWVKRQRYQFKLLMEGKPSTMTPERIQCLENIGFTWHSQSSAWYERLEDLREFKSVHGHCNVPSTYAENPKLATWVRCQRRQYNLRRDGKPSNITPIRIEELEELGFVWEMRGTKRRSSSN